VNYTWWAVKTYIAGKAPPVTVPLYSSISFDLTVTSIYLPLLTGGTIAIYSSEDQRFPVQEIVKEDRVDILKATPSHLRLLQHEITGNNQKLRTFIVGGEELERVLAQDIYLGFSRGVDIYNEYGPTEATVGCMIYKFNYEKDRRRSVSIGLPADNVSIYILNSSLNPVPINGVGEIYIGGAALARGYVNQPELTAEKFIVATKTQRHKEVYFPWCLGALVAKLYKTGDLARRLPDGNIEFLGRMDEQVKIRGYRIELKEIESQLLTHSNVKEALVITKETSRSEFAGETGDKVLCAYIVPEKDVEISELIAYLSVRLPDYMIPSFFMPVKRIPLTPNGKVDKKALPEPKIHGTKHTYAAPGNKIQVTLVDIWSKVLGIEKNVIGIDANFFELGGHSLKATILIAEIHKALDVKAPLAEIFKHPFIRELADYIDRTTVEEFSHIGPVEKKDYYVLSSAQKRHYIIQQLKLKGVGYNESIVAMLEGQLDRGHLEETFRELIQRHESLRTSFHMVKDEPVQRICECDEVEFEIEYYDLAAEITESTAGSAAAPPAIDIIKNFIHPFDLTQAPLFRVGLIKEEDQKHVLMVDMHHIVTDGTSMGILRREFMELYQGEELTPLEIQYKDFSGWQNSETIRESMGQQEIFWLKAFEGKIPVLELPTDYPRPVEKSFEGQAMGFALSIEASGALQELARQKEATLYMVLLAAFNILLYKLSACEDIVVGTPIAGRRHADLQTVIGMFVNTLAMRNYPRGDRTIEAFLSEVKTRTLEAFENQDYQFEELVDRLEVPRDTSRNPIFETMFAVQNMELPGVEIPQLRMLPYPREEHASPFDIIMSAHDVGQQLMFRVEYSTKLFKTDTIERIMGYFRKILSSVTGQPGQKISGIDLISEDEKNRVLTQFNDTAGEFPTDKTIHQLFEEQVEKTSDHVALIGPPGHWALTYKELNRKSNQLACLLRQTGIGPDKVVGLLVERSFEMVMGLLAILKAGAAYLPMDTEYPEERILLMLSDSGAPVLLTRGKMLDRFSITSLKNMKASHKGLVVTPPQAQIKNFDGLPKPDRTLVNYEKYHRYIGVAMAKHTVTLQATRGCPFNCAYCHKIWPKTHIVRSAGSILEEIRCCYDAGIRRFVFLDDIFNLDKRNSSEVLERIISQGLDIQLFFSNGMRGDILTKDFIDLMAEAGTVNVSLALESACPRIQRLIGKKLNLEKFLEIARYFIEKYPHIILEMGLMLGFPTETEREALMTLEFLESLKWVHFPNLHILKIYPNTDMFKLALDNGISEALIQRSANLAYHELPETLPFSKHFVREYQTRFMNGYFLSKERLLHVLPLQARTLTRDEFIQKYDSYLPMKINDFPDILDCAGISREESGNLELLPDHHMAAPDFNNKIKKHFPHSPKISNPFRVLLLDLSLFFSARVQQESMLYDMVEVPMGLMYLLTFLNEKFKARVWGKIAKSRIDFDSFEELKNLAADFKPDLIGIRTLSYYKEFFHQTVLFIRNWGIDVPIIAGGPYATSDYPLILQDHNVDLVVLGEGELVFTQLVEKMMENNNQLPGEDVLQRIRGIAFVKDKFKTPKNQEEKTAPGIPGHKENRTREIVLPDEISWGMNQYPGENLKPMNQAHDMLYVIYTSGSTGIPKAVMLEHRNLVNLMTYTFKHTQIDCSSVLQFATISFDVSFQEIFSTLLSGGKLVLVDSQTRGDIPGLFQVVEKNKIKTLFLPTSFLKFIFTEADYISLIPPGVRHLVTAGEQLVINDMLREYLKKNNVYLHNHYGPSETHVVTALTLDPRGEIPRRPSIGQPIMNTGIYILDKGSQLLPTGVPGELHIGGVQVGRGYLGKAALTGEKFIENPFVEGEKLYNTGDLSRWLPDGNIEFLGRIDQQVKIRGFRVEPGEIENQLLKYEEIKETVVVTKEDKNGDKYLCAYIVPTDETTIEKKPNITGLRESISQTLPDYMIPAYFIYLDNIPLTSNGKLNRRALPEPEAPGTGENYVAQRNELEEKLAAIWSEVLDISQSSLGVHDNFFQLGGHSLKATILASKIHKNLGVKLPLVQMFKTPNIKGLAGYIKKAEPHKFVSIEPVEKKEYYCLSSAQKRLYFLQQFDPHGIVYNLVQRVPWQKEIEIEKLGKIFRKLITRHESLRTSFEIVNREPVQLVHDKVDFKIEYYETGRPGHDTEEKVTRDFVQPFDLSRAPLMRTKLIKTGEKKYTLLIDMHHIITDGTAQDVLIKEFITLYSHGEEKLPGLALQYRDYAQWQNRAKHQESMKQQENYWIRSFSDELPVLNLPTDYPRPQIQQFEGGTVHFVFNREDTGNLKKSAEENDVTLYMCILAVFNILLSKLSGQEDIIIGTPIAARRHADLENIVGMFVNTLAIRNFPHRDKTFKTFLKEVKVRTLEAFENQEYPFEELVEMISISRDTSRNPIFDAVIMLTNQSEYTGYIPDIHETSYKHVKSNSKFDLTLIAVEKGKYLVSSLEYSASLFKPGTIDRMIGYFKKIAASIAARPDQKLSAIDLISEPEKEQILFDFNDTQTLYPDNKTLHELFAEQVKRTPDQIALVGKEEGGKGRRVEGKKTVGEINLSYRELNRKSDKLAHYLRSKGVAPGTIVGVLVERTPRMIEGLLGILKAGGAYLPLDPEYPEARLKYILEKSSTGILLTQENLMGKSKGTAFAGEIIDIFAEELYREQEPPGEEEIKLARTGIPTELAYVIYTSGSTGNPKGVMIPHKNTVNFISGMTKRIAFSPGKTIAALTTISFDIFFLETFLPLTCGLRVVIADERHRQDPVLLRDLIARNHVDMLQVTPSRLKLLLSTANQGKFPGGVETLIVGGEAFSIHLLEQVKEMFAGNIYNVYGPTETTIWSTVKDLTLCPPGELTIGTPIANTQVYIVDRQQRLQPLGAAGELLIGGDGAAAGYLNNPELTAEKFILATKTQRHKKVNFSWCPGALVTKLYKTGDLARWLTNGEIEFLGRVDYQVKIRGFRIELEEIQERLVNHEHIKEAVVIPGKNKDENSYLAAYIVPGVQQGNPTGTLSVSALREYLSQHLPEYMIPSYFVQLEKIPLTANGKIERKSLPSPGQSRLKPGETFVAPKTQLEKTIARVWKNTLKLESVGVNDSFFELGGNSMEIVIITNQLRNQLTVGIPVAAMFRYRTIRAFVSYLTQQEDQGKLETDRREALKRGEEKKRKKMQMRKRKIK
jgi:amino acid adenylation domain-containing protein